MLDDLALAVSVFSLGVAAASGWFTRMQAIDAGKARQLRDSLELLRLYDEAFEALIAAASDRERQFKLLRIANMLEHFCLFHNRRLVAGASASTVENLLLDAFANDLLVERLDPVVEKLSFNEETFREMRVFRACRRIDIGLRRARMHPGS